MGSTDTHLPASVPPTYSSHSGHLCVLSPILVSGFSSGFFSPWGPATSHPSSDSYFMFSTLRPRTAHTGIASIARKRIQPL